MRDWVNRLKLVDYDTIRQCCCNNTKWVRFVIHRCLKAVWLIVTSMLCKWQDWKMSEMIDCNCDGRWVLILIDKDHVLDVTPCSLVDGHERFGRNCCLNFQGTNSYPEDGGSRFLRYVASLPNYSADVFLVTTAIPSSVTYMQFMTEQSTCPNRFRPV